MRTVIAALLLALLAGCGSASSPDESAAELTQILRETATWQLYDVTAVDVSSNSATIYTGLRGAERSDLVSVCLAVMGEVDGVERIVVKSAGDFYRATWRSGQTRCTPRGFTVNPRLTADE
jgi:hypothetical protein